MTARRDALVSAVAARVATAAGVSVVVAVEGVDDAKLPFTEASLPGIVVARRRDVPQPANEKVDRVLDLEIEFCTAGASRMATAATLVEQVVPAVLATGGDMPRVRIREGETVWQDDREGETHILKTVVAISVGYRTERNQLS